MAFVLVIDDEPSVLEAVERLVRSLGHTAISANSGPAGLRLLKESSVDIVLIDIVMRGMNGLELMREAASAGSKAKFVAMSGGLLGLDNDWFQEALRHGAIQALPKPFGSLELSLAIQNALSAKPGPGR